MKKIKGSMTVEAAFALPFYIFVMANILCLFLSYERYSKTLAGIHQTTKMAALACHGISMDSDTVDMSIPVALSPFIGEIGFIPSFATAHASVRKWTGYDVCSYLAEEEEEDSEDFIGWTLLDKGRIVGTVTGIEPIPGNLCLIVGDTLVPLHEDLVLSADPEKRILDLDLPEGLF